MQIVKGIMPFVVAFSVVSIITVVLWIVRLEAVGPQHLVFFYLLPTAIVAVLYGHRPPMFFALAATACAAFFLYEPLYSFEVANPLELGELICFTGLALIGAKCAADLLRPAMRVLRQHPAIED